QALKKRAALGPQAKLLKELEDLRQPIFDPDYQPSLTVKNPKNGEDPLAASGNNLYEGVTMADLKDFRDKYPLNSRLVKKDGKLVEQVYRAGGPNGRAPAGLYPEDLNRAVPQPAAALPYANAHRPAGALP